MNTHWFAFIGNSIILRRHADGTHSIPCQPAAPTELKPWTTLQELPELDSLPCRAYNADVSHGQALAPGLVTMELRASYNVLPPAAFRLAGKAAQLLYWDTNTRYCGHCGGTMERQTAISKRCTNCGKEVWPQVAPAIIVRILRRDTGQILLVHARNFRRTEMYGLVAGFVETGESLEECVRREIREETQLEISNLRYFGSQSWPFPCGIMLGFTADYASGTLRLQQAELSRAGWFAADQLPPIPDRMSIARRLIDDWLTNECKDNK